MTKKDFSGALRRTATVQRDLIEDRFSKADSVLLGMAASPDVQGAVNPVAAIAEPGPMPAAAALTSTPVESVGRGIGVIRDTFSMPPCDHRLIEALRTRAAREGRNTTKSEVVRAGLAALVSQSSAELVALLDSLERVRPGRK